MRLAIPLTGESGGRTMAMAAARKKSTPGPEGTLIVIKFGGTSLATPARMRHAARRVHAHVRAGHRVLVVVSAAGATTDRILARLRALGAGHAHREYDRALATGEDLSAALFAATLQTLGVRARSLRGGEAGIVAHGEFGAGKLETLDATSLSKLLAQDIVPVVAGFQATRVDGETVTIGRNGSDATAVFLAGLLHADACHIVTDVGAICDSDPRTNPAAQSLPQLSYSTLRQLTESGSNVVQREAALLAERFGTELHVYHFRAPFHQPRGTVVAAAH
jgi:aspartate kinase